MRSSSEVNKENVVPAYAEGSSPESSPLKATPTRSQRISWSNADQHHTYSDSVKNIPSSGKTRDPARSILKRSVQIEPMEQLMRPATPEPEDVINNEHYLASPIATITESVREGSTISCSDLREAYALLTTRIRIKVHPDNVLSSFPIFKPLHDYHEQLTTALERDLGRCFIDPLASPPSVGAYPDSTDVFSTVEIPMSSSPIREVKKRGMNDVEIRYARDLYSVCHGAIRLVSNIFAIPQLCTIFDEDELNTLLTALLAIPLASDIPTPNSRKTYSLAIFALQTQRLPMDVVEPAKPRITCAFSRAIEGELGKEGKKGAATDALKAVTEHLHSEPAEFLDAFVDLMPSILQSILSPNVSIRTQCVHAFGAFVVARTGIDMDDPANSRFCDTLDAISQQVGNYIDGLHEASIKAAARAAEKASEKAGGKASEKAEKAAEKKTDILSKALKITLNSEDAGNKVTGPIWGACILSTIIVLSGGQLFKRPNTLKMILDCMPYLTKHKNVLVKGIGRLVWRCFVWAFTDLQKSIDEQEDGKQQRASCEAAWKIVRQVVDGSVGIATTVAVLWEHSPRGVRRALDVVKNMFAGGSKSHNTATEILHHLTSGMSKRSVRRECAFNPENALLYAGLFDGNLMNFDETTLATTLQKVVKLVEVKAIRALTEAEVSSAWPSLCALWKVALFGSELEEDGVPTIVLSIWRNLLISNAKEQYDEPDSPIQQRIVGIFRECLSSREHPDFTDIQRMRICQQLWQVVFKVYTPEACQHLAHAVLDDLADFDLSCVDEDVLPYWAEYCAAVLITAPQDTLETWTSSSELELDTRRLLWAELCRLWHTAEDAPYQGAVLLLLSPFRAWSMSTDEWSLWESLVSIAIQNAGFDDIPQNLFVDRLCELIIAVEDDLLTLSEVIKRLFSFVAADENEVAPSALYTLIAQVLEQQYPPRRVDLDFQVDLLRDMGFFIQSMSCDMILPFFEATCHGLCLWIADQQEIFSVQQFNEEIIPLYQHCLKALQTVDLTLPHLDGLANLLVSPLQRLSSESEGSNSFMRFWEHVLRVIPCVRDNCPEVLASFLIKETDISRDVDLSDNVAHDTFSGSALASAAALSPKSEDGSSQIESEDELDWVHKTPSPAPLNMEDIESDSEKDVVSREQRYLHSSPHTPPRPRATSNADLAFCIESATHTASPLVLPSRPRSVLGKRQRVLAQQDNDDVEDIFSVGSTSSDPVTPARRASSCDSSISVESFSSHSRKRRVLDAVVLPRMRAEDKDRHVHMSSLTMMFLPSKSVAHLSSQALHPECTPPARD